MYSTHATSRDLKGRRPEDLGESRETIGLLCPVLLEGELGRSVGVEILSSARTPTTTTKRLSRPSGTVPDRRSGNGSVVEAMKCFTCTCASDALRQKVVG